MDAMYLLIGVGFFLISAAIVRRVFPNAKA